MVVLWEYRNPPEGYFQTVDAQAGIMVDQWSQDFEVPPRGQKHFQATMTVGYEIILDWETDGQKIIFWICSPTWTGKYPPEQSAIAYQGYGRKMYNYQFKPTSLGVWSFIFYNDYTSSRSVSLHYVIFRDATAPDLSQTPETKPPLIFNRQSVMIGAAGIFVILILVRFYLSPRETSHGKRKRQSRERYEQRKK